MHRCVEMMAAMVVDTMHSRWYGSSEMTSAGRQGRWVADVQMCRCVDSKRKSMRVGMSGDGKREWRWQKSVGEYVVFYSRCISMVVLDIFYSRCISMVVLEQCCCWFTDVCVWREQVYLLQ